MKTNANDICCCGQVKAYIDCCGRYIDAGELPETAEKLMRSRYTAYVLGRTDFLLATWHPHTRPVSLALTTQQKWLDLSVKKYEQLSPEHAVVEFVARYKVAGRTHCLHEISRFVFERGRWLYVEGEFI